MINSLRYEKIMENYSLFSHSLAEINQTDFLTDQQLNILSSKNPRGSINLRYNDDQIVSYNLNTLIDLISKGLPDPYTKQPFTKNSIRRICLYIEGLKNFPNYKLNTIDLFNRWIETYSDNQLEKSIIEKIRLEARCFLQVEDLRQIFQKYCGNGHLINREFAEAQLKDQSEGSWLIRESSIIESMYDKPKVITIKTAQGYRHQPFIHKIGIGFFMIDIWMTQRHSQAKDVSIINDSFQPSIIDLLENISEIKIINAYRG